MPNDGPLLMALAHDAQFLNRVQFALCQVALEVAAENPATANHAARRAFAASVLGNPGAAAAAAAVALVGAVNITASVVTIKPSLDVVSDATDAAIASQVSTLWNSFAGV